MRTYAICPISNKKIDEHVARINGLITVVLLGLFLITSVLYIILFLSVDFFLRSTELAKFSPVAIFSRKIVSLLALKPTLINAGHKVFAARIGFVFTVSVLLSSALGFEIASYVFTAVFGICALLEAALGFCLACEIYPFVYKFLYQSNIKES